MMDNPLDMPLGRQNRAAKVAGMTLEEWRDSIRNPVPTTDDWFDEPDDETENP